MLGGGAVSGAVAETGADGAVQRHAPLSGGRSTIGSVGGGCGVEGGEERRSIEMGSTVREEIKMQIKNKENHRMSRHQENRLRK